MKFKCDAKELSVALEIVGKAIKDNQKIPLLNGIKIKTSNKSVILIGSSTELYIEKKINAKILIDGEVLLLSKEFNNVISSLVGEIEIEKVGKALVVNYGKGNKADFICSTSEGFPEIDLSKEGDTFTIKESDLKDGIDKTAFCVSIEQNPMNKTLKGILFDINEKELNLVAIDGSRVAIVKKPIVSTIENREIVVPGKIIEDVVKILDKSSNDIIDINVRKNFIIIDLDHTKILINLIDGKFIDYKKFCINKIDTTVVIEKQSFLSGLNRILSISKNLPNNYMSIDIKDENFNISSKSAPSSIEENIECKIDGKELTIGFNSRNLKDCVDRIDEDFFKMEFVGVSAPVNLLPIKGDEYRYLLMSMRVL